MKFLTRNVKWTSKYSVTVKSNLNAFKQWRFIGKTLRRVFNESNSLSMSNVSISDPRWCSQNKEFPSDSTGECQRLPSTHTNLLISNWVKSLSKHNALKLKIYAHKHVWKFSIHSLSHQKSLFLQPNEARNSHIICFLISVEIFNFLCFPMIANICELRCRWTDFFIYFRLTKDSRRGFLNEK